MEQQTTAASTVGYSKRAKRKNLILTIIFFIVSLLMIMICFVSKAQVSSIEESIAYKLNDPTALQQYQQFQSMIPTSIVLMIIWLTIAVLTLVSLLSVKGEKLTVGADGVEGRAGRHFLFCFGTKKVSLTYAQISEAAGHGDKLRLTEKNGKKYTFLLENASETAKLIRSRKEV